MVRSRVSFFLFLFFFLAVSLRGEVVGLNQEDLKEGVRNSQRDLERMKRQGVEEVSFLKEGTVYFKGDDLSINFKKNTKHLKGNVLIRDVDFMMESDEAYLYMKEVDGIRKVEKIEAFGSVHVVKKKTKDSEKIEAFSEKAFYFPFTEELSLFDKAKLIRLEDVMEGDEIHYNIATETMTGESVSGYVKINDHDEKS